jgi:hypothetical protein
MIQAFASIFDNGITILEIAIALLVAWIIISIPAWIAGKIVTKGKATFGKAMLATLLGPIVYIAVLVVLELLLGGLLGSTGYIIGFGLAFVAWVWVYKVVFKTGWLGGLAIAILALIVFVIMLVIIVVLLGFVPSLLPSQPVTQF